jgi:hypothetical protein
MQLFSALGDKVHCFILLDLFEDLSAYVRVRTRCGKHALECNRRKPGAFMSSLDNSPRRDKPRAAAWLSRLSYPARDKSLADLSHFGHLALLQVRSRSHGTSKLAPFRCTVKLILLSQRRKRNLRYSYSGKLLPARGRLGAKSSLSQAVKPHADHDEAHTRPWGIARWCAS